MSPTDRPVLRFVGPAVVGAPARDLTAHDLDRLAYKAALAKTHADGVRPPRPTAAEIQAVSDQLTARGRYVPVKQRSKKES